MRGITLVAMCKTVREAAQLDSVLYERLVLIRPCPGRLARKGSLAEKELKNSLKRIEASL